MNSLEEVLKKFPPKYASEVSGSQAWYFLLAGGKLIGGGEGITHRLILGIEPHGEVGHYDLEVQFCLQNQALRIAVFDSLNVEIFHVMPNEEQWSAIGTLYRATDQNPMTWDIWLKDDTSNHPWLKGEGTVMDFRRCFDRLMRPDTQRASTEGKDNHAD